jgi:hypothetical protein
MEFIDVNLHAEKHEIKKTTSRLHGSEAQAQRGPSKPNTIQVLQRFFVPELNLHSRWRSPLVSADQVWLGEP